MHISQATKCNIETQHALNNSYTPDILLSVNTYLGVILQSDLKWHYYVEEKVTKAN